ncbi:unnamed protein product [Kuraishia capsulata CBS 1993]|uniref:Fe2OG dioxygenase domain-containing protein n=1 Tax=Kuraishia capsulata CBS 1993 TaxID=1382522 RepID=W6MU30_9ASCO|nr:uncharacterized protein KUCA_T00001369001 [Kuraishia capsulata CBS 1993]CDK25400.1 unnamed protein product [Kuraishia capsulata CBS 1993]
MTRTMELPSIDISPMFGVDQVAIDRVVKAIRDACLDKGFFQIFNHGISPQLQDDAFKASKWFFALPKEEKLNLDKSKNSYNRGYESVGSQMFEETQNPDLKEGFYVGKEISKDHPLFGKINCGPNLWPSVEGSDHFRRVCMEYREKVFNLSKIVLRAIALGLGTDVSYFDTFTQDAIAIMRLLHYPAQEQLSDNDRGIGAHTDFGALTLLLQGDVGGLQVLDDVSGEWIDVAPTKGAYVVNLGDMMQRWSNDVYHSNVHRVLNIVGQERYSIPLFLNGNPDCLVKCLPGCELPGGISKYPPITVEDYVSGKYGDSYSKAMAFKNKY